MGDASGFAKIFYGNCLLKGILIILWSYIAYYSHFVSPLQVILLIACLLIVSAISELVADYCQAKNADEYYLDHDVTFSVFLYINMSTFDVAHWIFTYSYYAISRRIKSQTREQREK